jgi:hypothetical protein
MVASIRFIGNQNKGSSNKDNFAFFSNIVPGITPVNIEPAICSKLRYQSPILFNMLKNITRLTI